MQVQILRSRKTIIPHPCSGYRVCSFQYTVVIHVTKNRIRIVVEVTTWRVTIDWCNPLRHSKWLFLTLLRETILSYSPKLVNTNRAFYLPNTTYQTSNHLVRYDYSSASICLPHPVALLPKQDSASGQSSFAALVCTSKVQKLIPNMPKPQFRRSGKTDYLVRSSLGGTISLA